MAIFPNAKESDFVNIDIGDSVIVRGKIKVSQSEFGLENCELVHHRGKVKNANAGF